MCVFLCPLRFFVAIAPSEAALPTARFLLLHDDGRAYHGNGVCLVRLCPRSALLTASLERSGASAD